MKDETVTVGPDGLLQNPSGTLLARPVNNVLTQLVSLDAEDALILRLYQETGHRFGRASDTSDAIPREISHQFVMPVETAERLAEMLQEFLEATHGAGEARQ